MKTVGWFCFFFLNKLKQKQTLTPRQTVLSVSRSKFSSNTSRSVTLAVSVHNTHAVQRIRPGNVIKVSHVWTRAECLRSSSFFSTFWTTTNTRTCVGSRTDVRHVRAFCPETCSRRHLQVFKWWTDPNIVSADITHVEPGETKKVEHVYSAPRLPC